MEPPTDLHQSAEYERAVELLRGAGYSILAPVEPDEMYRREMEVTDMLAANLGPSWRRAADNSLDLADENVITYIVVHSSRKSMR